MKNMNHKTPVVSKAFDAPISAEEMQRMPGRENREKRTRAGKIFNLGRGLHQAVLFADPVHYHSKATGQWEEIDNTLIPVTDAAGGVYLTNRANDELNVEFHSTSDVATVLMQDDNDRLLAWRLEDAQDVAPVRVGMQRSVVNLLKNHNFESSDGWSFTNANSAAGNTIDYSTDSPHMGTRCVKATVVDGFRCDMQQWVTLERGKTYTASYYAKCTGSMRVWLETYTSDEGWTVFEKPPVQAVSAYQRYQNSFVVPGTSGTCSVYIGIRIGSGNGTAWVDNVQLEEGPVANRYNMLINGDFTFNAGAHPTGWSKNSSNDASDIVYTTCTGTKPEGLSANTMRMYGTGRTKYAGIYQDIPVSGNQGDVFVAGGWSFNYSKPRMGEDYRYNIRVAFLKSGTSSTRENTPSIEWSEEWTDWQFAAGPVVAPCAYTSIRFNVDYERNINYAEFGGLFLHKEEFGQTYTYDSKGNVLSAKNAASLQDGATYDAFDNILTYYQPGRSSSVKTTMEWGTTDAEKKKHLLRKSTSPLGIVNEYTYDSHGNQLTSKTSNGSLFMKTTSGYDEDGNHVLTQTDARGKTVTRVMNPSNWIYIDTVQSITDPRGQTVEYEYDQNRKVTKTSATVNGKEYANSYAYTHDQRQQHLALLLRCAEQASGGFVQWNCLSIHFFSDKHRS